MSDVKKAAQERFDQFLGSAENKPFHTPQEAQPLYIKAFEDGAAWLRQHVLWLIANQEGVSHWTDTDTVELIKSELAEKESE